MLKWGIMVCPHKSFKMLCCRNWYLLKVWKTIIWKPREEVSPRLINYNHGTHNLSFALLGNQEGLRKAVTLKPYKFLKLRDNDKCVFKSWTQSSFKNRGRMEQSAAQYKNCLFSRVMQRSPLPLSHSQTPLPALVPPCVPIWGVPFQWRKGDAGPWRLPYMSEN